MSWQLWVVAGVVLWVAEFLVPSFFLGVLGLACLAGAASSVLGLGATAQFLVFGIASVIVGYLFQPLLGHLARRSGADQASNVDALLGRVVQVTEVSAEDASRGRVMLGSESWMVRARDGDSLAVGSRVTVMRCEGSTLFVTKSTHPL